MKRNEKRYFCFSFSAICVFSFDSSEDEMAFPVDVRTLETEDSLLARFSELGFDGLLSITNLLSTLPASGSSLFQRDYEGIIITISIL